jgi:hypothetical protein
MGNRQKITSVQFVEEQHRKSLARAVKEQHPLSLTTATQQMFLGGGYVINAIEALEHLATALKGYKEQLTI